MRPWLTPRALRFDLALIFYYNEIGRVLYEKEKSMVTPDMASLRFTVPIRHHDGLLYPIFTGGTKEECLKERALSSAEFDRVSIFAGLCKTCKDRGDVPNDRWPAIPYCKVMGPHFHLSFQCEDGSGTVPAPIASRPFFDKVLENLQMPFKAGEQELMLEVLEATCLKDLKLQLTDTEKKLLDTPKVFEDLLRFSFVS
jgi:hypothetical protein